MTRNHNKYYLLCGTLSSLCIFLTACYPNGKLNKNLNDDSIVVEENESAVKGKLDEGLFVNAETDIKTEADWKEKTVVLKSWDSDEAKGLFGKEKEIKEDKIIPNIHNDSLMDHYIYWEDGSMLVVQRGNLQYYTPNELEYSYFGYLYGTLPYLTEEAAEKFPEADIPDLDKEEAIKQVTEIVEKLEIEVSEPRVYAMTYERLEADTDYSQTDPNGNPPHRWTETDAVYAVVFQGMQNQLPITEIGYRSGPAAGERIVGIVGKQGLVAFHALNIYEVVTEKELSEPIGSVREVLENIRKKFRNVLIVGRIEIEKISLEYVPALENIEKGEFQIKPVFVCMAEQSIEPSQKTKEEGLYAESSIFPILFDAQTGIEIQTGGNY